MREQARRGTEQPGAIPLCFRSMRHEDVRHNFTFGAGLEGFSPRLLVKFAGAGPGGLSFGVRACQLGLMSSIRPCNKQTFG